MSGGQGEPGEAACIEISVAIRVVTAGRCNDQGQPVAARKA